MNLIELFNSIFMFLMWMGFIWAMIHAVKAKKPKAVAKIIFIPFYVFYYLLKLPDEDVSKKPMIVLTIGCFWLVLFFGILQIVFTPPV